jgi:hypothetical protein
VHLIRGVRAPDDRVHSHRGPLESSCTERGIQLDAYPRVDTGPAVCLTDPLARAIVGRQRTVRRLTCAETRGSAKSCMMLSQGIPAAVSAELMAAGSA